MTPMIDVVFLLIIFFLVSSHLARQELRHPVDLAAASAAQQSLDSVERLVIAIDANGSLHFRGREISLETLGTQLRRDRPDGDAIRLRIDRQAKYADVKPILRALTRQGISNVAMAVIDRGL